MDIVSLNCIISLVGDVFFVNGVPFMITLSRCIQLISGKFVAVTAARDLANSLIKVIYGQGGFSVCTIFVDNKFQKLLEKNPNPIINTTANNEHDHKYERKISVIKERTTCIIDNVPFKIW